MNDIYFDIIVVTDPRFQGGTSSAITAEVTAAVQTGYSVGLVCYEAINLKQPLPFHGQLRGLIDRRQLTLVTPGTHVLCRLAILHNPFVAGLLPVEPLNITAEKRMVIVHHPPIDGHGLPSYDLHAAMRNAEEILSGPADWVPVGPNARKAFAACVGAPALLPDDWANVIDFDAWRHRPEQRQSKMPRIGRHSRADPRKFPASRAAFMQIYGDGTRAHVDLLGCAPETLAMLQPSCPNWTLRRFGNMPVRAYLDSLDAFVYYHREDWVEAFGYAVLEAMARGLPCVLPPTLAPSFGAAARIAPAHQAFEATFEVLDDRAKLQAAGYDLINDHHSFAAAVRRFNDLIGPPAKATNTKPARRPPEPSALLISTNGIGMGHLTRTLAIARRLHAPVKPIIVTMSHGAAVAKELGYHVEFIPYHAYLDTAIPVWNLALRDELKALIDAHGARVVLFDGNSPFQGLIDALAAHPEVWSIWCRRGMWQSNASTEFIKLEKFFDAVIEPRDLAGDFDAGPTTSSRNLTRTFDPIRLLDRQERLPRDEARAELGLDPDATTILLQLGGGNNFDIRLTRDLVLRHLGGRKNIQVALIGWKISATPPPQIMPDNVVLVSAFPIARYLNAFDATVSAVGYNSFHEAIDAGLPAIYVPNENPAQDDQLARASFAARHGAALVARRHNPESLITALEAILDPARRASMTRAALTLKSPNGAVDAAQLITQYALSYRGDRAEE